MDTLADTKTYLKLPDEEWSKQVYFRLAGRILDDLEPSHPRPQNLTLGRRKSIDLDSRQKRPYKYRPLPSLRSIRLLRLIGFDEDSGVFIAILKTCDIDHVDYAALSYTWGLLNDGWEDLIPIQNFSPWYRLLVIEELSFNRALFDLLKTPQLPSTHSVPDDEIYLIDIGKNLSDFFRSFSDTKTGSKMPAILNLLWIDAVCINQDDPAEKEVQISLMGEIYSKATAVVAWLGNAPPQIDTVVWMNDCFLPSLIQRKHPDVPLEAYMENVSKANPGDDAYWLTNAGLQPKESDWLKCWDIFLRFFQRTRWSDAAGSCKNSDLHVDVSAFVILRYCRLIFSLLHFAFG